MIQAIDLKRFVFVSFLFGLVFLTGCMHRKPEKMISKLKDVKKIEIVINRDFFGESYQVFEEDPEKIEILLESFTLWGAVGKPIYPSERFNNNGKLIFHRRGSENLVLEIDLLSGQGGDPGFRLERKGRIEYTYFTKATEQILVGIICDYLDNDSIQ